jgi:hypothetical protein
MRLLLISAFLLAAADNAAAQALTIRNVPRDDIESRLREYGGSNVERGARLKQMFADAGCGEQLSEQHIRFSKAPNVICVLPGTSDQVIIVGAHFDRVPRSDGVADNWSGASLLPSLYRSVNVEPRHHTYVFIGFTDEELGLIGSRAYVRRMTPAQIAATAAMVNIDTLGLATTEVWASRSDKRLVGALVSVSDHLKLPLHGVDFQNVGSTDSESFARKKIPRITIHTLTQKSHDQGILHSPNDKLSAMNLDYYYDTYHLLAVYLVYLDHFLRRPKEPPEAQSTALEPAQ